MTERVKDLRRRMRAGGTITVCNTDFPTPGLMEFVGGLGFDAAFIDCEHSATDFREVEELTRAARVGGMASVVRPWSKEPGLVNRYLSCGADGIQIPHVDTPAETADILAGLQGWEGDHREKLLILMIESAQAIENLPELLAFDAVDVFYIGSHDLALSMGWKGRPDHPEVRARVARAISTIAGRGRVAGMNLQGDIAALDHYRGLGLRWINVHLKVFMKEGAGRFLKAARME